MSERLAALLTTARDHVPFYQQSLSGLEIAAANALDVLRSLQVLRRDDVRAHQPQLWSSQGDPAEWRSVRTTGSTGTPLEVILDLDAQEAERETLHEHIAGIAPGDRSVFHLTLHASARTRAAGRVVKWNLTRAWWLPDDRLAEHLQVIDGQVVTAMPSVMAALATRVRTVRPAVVVLSGEAAEKSVRERVHSAFGCPVTSLYTLAEVGIAGVECPAGGGYHPAPSVVVELLDGKVTLTSLANHAMPLLRYQPGDEATWTDTACGCPRREPAFHLTRSRSTHGVSQVGLSKLLAQLNIRVHSLTRTQNGVAIRHGGPPLPEASAATLSAAVRGLLGPSTAVEINPVSDQPVMTGSRDSARRSTIPELHVTGWRPEPEAVAEWAREWLHDVPGVHAATLAGSALSPETFTRFSDIDLILFVDDCHDPRWLNLARSMHRHMTGLRVNAASSHSLAHTPLLRARLLSERHQIFGSVDIPWPDPQELVAESHFWRQDAHATLWTQATAPNQALDPIRTAWLAARCVLAWLRYDHLTRGARVTKAEELLDRTAPATATSIRTILDTATERRPPNASDDHLAAALALLRQ